MLGTDFDCSGFLAAERCFNSEVLLYKLPLIVIVP